MVQIDGNSRLTGIEPVADMNMQINGGYFILRQEIFDNVDPGDDLVTDAFTRAAHAGEVPGRPLRWLLGAHGHAQGACGARRDASEW